MMVGLRSSRDRCPSIVALERPHVVVYDSRYYLFTSTHGFSFADRIDGPPGLYGFISESLRGRYVPLNRSGLVMANPPEAPQQAYSWMVLPDDLSILSFVNYIDMGDVQLSEIKDQTPEWQRDHFGGTPAPLTELSIDGDTTSVGELVPLAELAGG